MNVFIQHDISKVKDISFMGHNIWNMIEWEKVFITNKVSGVEVPEKSPIFYIYIYSSGGHDINSSIYNTIQDIHSDAVIYFTTLQEYQEIQQRIIYEGDIYIQMDSDIILPQVIVRDKIRYFPDCEQNIWLPVSHYKYYYKTVKWKNKKYTVKSFAQCKDNFYNTNIMLDWDERYYITHALFGKLKGSLPLLNPSPLLHQWGMTAKTIIKNHHPGPFTKEHDITLSDYSSFITKFERVPDDSV